MYHRVPALSECSFQAAGDGPHHLMPTRIYITPAFSATDHDELLLGIDVKDLAEMPGSVQLAFFSVPIRDQMRSWKYCENDMPAAFSTIMPIIRGQ